MVYVPHSDGSIPFNCPWNFSKVGFQENSPAKFIDCEGIHTEKPEMVRDGSYLSSHILRLA